MENRLNRKTVKCQPIRFNANNPTSDTRWSIFPSALKSWYPCFSTDSEKLSTEIRWNSSWKGASYFPSTGFRINSLRWFFCCKTINSNSPATLVRETNVSLTNRRFSGLNPTWASNVIQFGWWKALLMHPWSTPVIYAYKTRNSGYYGSPSSPQPGNPVDVGSCRRVF